MDRRKIAEELAEHLYSDAMDSAVNAFCFARWDQDKHPQGGASGEDKVRGQLAAAIVAFLTEIPESGLIRLARPPAPNGDGTTVGAQPAAHPLSEDHS